MKIDNSQISGRRFMYSIAFFLQASALLTSYVASAAEQDSWIAVIISALLFIPLIFLYSALMVMFPDKNFLQVLEEVYGKVVGKILVIACAWFYLTLTALNLRDIGDFTSLMLMPETPNMVLILICTLVAVWAARNGLSVVTRYSKLFTIIEIIVVIVSIMLLANQVDFSNLLPMLTKPFIRYVQSTHIILTIPLGEVAVFLMLTPCVKRMTFKETVKYWSIGVGMGALVLLVVLIRDITLLGNSSHLLALPGLVSLRLVNMGEALSRVEILYSIALIMLLFFKITVLCYVSTISIAHLFKTTQYRHLALVVGMLILFYAPTLFSQPGENSFFARKAAPFSWGIFEILLPLTTFILAKIRKLPQPALATTQEREV